MIMIIIIIITIITIMIIIIHPPPLIRKVGVGLRVCAFLVHKEKCSSMCEEAFKKLDAEPGSIKISNLGRWLKNFWCVLAACPGTQKRDVLNRFLAKRQYFFNPGPGTRNRCFLKGFLLLLLRFLFSRFVLLFLCFPISPKAIGIRFT